MKTLFLGFISLLLMGSIFGVWWTFSHPTESQESVTEVSYRHSGEFDYQVYVNSGTLYGLPSEPEEPDPIYPTLLIDSIDVSFSYQFVPDEQVTKVTEVVEVTALVEVPGWQKELTLVPETTKTGDFTVDFSLDLEELNELIETFEEETGTYITSTDVTIEADVHVVAQTDAGAVEDDFVQTTKTTLTSTTLTWEQGLSLSQAGFYEGLSYEHQGNFDYVIHLIPNIVYETETLTPPTPATSGPSVALPTGLVYFRRTIDDMEASFSYDFDCDQRLHRASAEVEVTAILEYPGMWSKTFVLVPLTTETRDFEVTFPVALDYYYELTDIIRDEIGLGAASYNLTLRASVHMVAQLDHAIIDEVFTQSLPGKLGTTTLTWENDLTESQSGSIEETETVPIPGAVPARAGSVAGLLLGVLLGSYAVRKYTRAEPRPRTALEAEAQRVKKKHKDVIVDVEELPEAEAEGMVISLSSLDELVKAADALLKPVLHKAEAERHTYCVIDGLTRYEYVSLEKPE